MYITTSNKLTKKSESAINPAGFSAKLKPFVEPITNGQGSVRDIMAFITIAAALLIGAYILGMFVDVMPALNSTNPFHDLMDTIANVATSGYGLLVIVLIVIAFVIIIGYLTKIGNA